MTRALLPGIPAVALTAALAFAIKAHHRDASPEALDFALAPTAALVGALTGGRFETETGVGYRDPSLGVAITSACAGMNFWVIALCALSLGFLGRFDGAGARLAWVPVAALLAFGATLVANAARIALAIALRSAAPGDLGLTPESLHRLEGIAVYLAVLLCALLVVDRALARPGRSRARLVALGLAVYAGVTVGLPWLRGSAGPGFAEHALWIGAAAGLVAAIAAIAAIGAIARRDGAGRWTVSRATPAEVAHTSSTDSS